jgi:Ala-tRNA(Pro) deacylase
MTESELYALLDERGVSYEVFHHKAVETVAEADAIVPRLAIPTKNLFLRDNKKRDFFLVVAAEDTDVDLKHLHKQLNTRRLSFASSEMLMEKLGLVQGSVTPFGILNDDTREVTLVFDERLAHERFDAHPMVNTATMFIHMDEVLPLFEEHGNPVVFCDLTCQTGPAAQMTQ